MSKSRLFCFVSFLGLVAFTILAQPAHGQALLRYKFQVGQKCRLTSQQTMQMKMNMPGAEGQPPINSNTLMQFDWLVTAVDSAGVATLTQTARTVQMKMQGPQGMAMDYDSESDAKPEGLATMVAPVLGAMIGKSYVIRMDSQGNILDLKLPEGVADEMKKLPGMAQMGDMFSEEKMKDMSQLASFPEGPVKVGDTWNRTVTVKNPLTGNMTTDTKFSYLGPEVVKGRELEKIGQKVTLTFAQGGQIAIELTDQSNEGVLYFDNALGRFVRSDVKMKMTMQMSAMGQQFSQQMETTAKIELEPVTASE